MELAKIAVRCMVGKSLRDQGIGERFAMKHVAVKEAVFPFIKFRGVDPILGPEMRSTGEVMGIAADFETAFAKAEAAAGTALPNSDRKGPIFISVSDDDRPAIVEVARALQELGWPILATEGTRKHIYQAGIRSELIHKIDEGRPNIIDRMRQREIALVVNTPGREPWTHKDEALIRRTAVETGTPYITTISAARAVVRALRKPGDWWNVRSLQEYIADNLG
jgi:carbamoyl-phosphate synthase large subunit